MVSVKYIRTRRARSKSFQDDPVYIWLLNILLYTEVLENCGTLLILICIWFLVGFCECGSQFGGLVLYYDCGHDVLTCQQVWLCF